MYEQEAQKEDANYLATLRSHDANAHCSKSPSCDNNTSSDIVIERVHAEQIEDGSKIRCIFRNLCSVQGFLLLIIIVLIVQHLRTGSEKKKTSWL
jgi:hypothetical protein